jgi:UDP-N-acetylglucosamine--N-acetylmuramyl-(pentapeptide) pyrophosphoryl-undecaprenol N-acetylglucosamine transferase
MGSLSNNVMKKMTFFCSPIGLGHVTRDSAIVQHIPEISTKFVTGNAAAKFLEQLQFDVEDVYTPPQFKIENGLLENPLRWLWNYYKYYKDCKNRSNRRRGRRVSTLRYTEQ